MKSRLLLYGTSTAELLINEYHPQIIDERTLQFNAYYAYVSVVFTVSRYFDMYDCVFVVFDVSKMSTFNEALSILPSIPYDIPIVIIGDRGQGERVVTPEIIQRELLGMPDNMSYCDISVAECKGLRFPLGAVMTRLIGRRTSRGEVDEIESLTRKMDRL